LEARLASYQSNLVSPISGRPLAELERIDVTDFDRVFGRGVASRSAAFSAISASNSYLQA
jgi:hypothetical protein